MVNQKRDEEWAVNLFRPLVQKLELQKKSESPVLVKVSDFRHLVIKGMGRCLIVLQRRSLSEHNPTNKGYFAFIHHKGTDLYILSIVIDSNLYRDDSLELKIGRKAIGMHEFCHCIAAMLSLAEVSSNSLAFEKLRNHLCEKVAKTSSTDFINLMAAFSNLDQESDSLFRPFSDSHFRLGFEDFIGDYSELYINLLLPYTLVTEVLGEGKLQALKDALSKTSENPAVLVEFLSQLVSDLSEQKALDKGFVIKRLQVLLPRLLHE